MSSSARRPSTNLAESFNSIWSNSDTNNLSLVDAAYYDTVESLMLETEFECFEAGTFKGHCPDIDNREQKERVEQMRRARAYAEQIAKESETISEGQNSRQNASAFFTPTNSSHRPDKRSSSSERPTSFKKHKGSQQRGAKWRQTRSKAFQQSLKKAKNEPYQLVSANVGKNEFMVYSVDSRNTYLVSVATTPQCECPFLSLSKNNTQQICKHILWVYLFVLDIPEESRLINQV